MKIEVQYSAWSAHSLSVQVISKIFYFFISAKVLMSCCLRKKIYLRGNKYFCDYCIDNRDGCLFTSVALSASKFFKYVITKTQI